MPARAGGVALRGVRFALTRTPVSTFSYRGEVTVGLMVDAKLIPDPDQIVGQLQRELTALGRLDRPPRRARRSRAPSAHDKKPR